MAEPDKSNEEVLAEEITAAQKQIFLSRQALSRVPVSDKERWLTAREDLNVWIRYLKYIQRRMDQAVDQALEELIGDA